MINPLTSFMKAVIKSCQSTANIISSLFFQVLLPPEGLQRRARPPRRVPRSRPGPRRRRRRSAPLNNITIYYLLNKLKQKSSNPHCIVISICLPAIDDIVNLFLCM